MNMVQFKNLFNELWTKLLSDSILYLFANLLYASSLLFSSIFLTFHISVSDYGRQSYLYSIISLLSQITLFGQGGYNLLFGKDIKSGGSIFDYFSIVVLVFLTCSSVLITLQLFFFDISKFELLIILFTLLANSLCLGIFPYLIALKKNRLMIYLKVIQSLSLIFCVYLIIFSVDSKWHLHSRIVAIMMSSALVTLILVILLKENKNRINIMEVKKRLKFGIRLVPHIVFGTFLITGDKYFIKYNFGEVDLGIYNFAFQLAMPILFVGTAINQSFVVNFLKLENKTSAFEKYATSIVVVFVSVIYQLFILFLFSFEIFSEKYKTSLSIFFVLSIAILIQSLYMNESSKLLKRLNPLFQSLISFSVFIIWLIVIYSMDFENIYTFSYSLILIWTLMFSFTKTINYYVR